MLTSPFFLYYFSLYVHPRPLHSLIEFYFFKLIDGVKELETFISRKKAILIIIATVLGLLIIGSIVGYTFFWSQYDQTPSSEKKISQLQEQMIVNPEDIGKQLDLGWTYHQQGKYKEAKEVFEVILNQDKNHYDARFGLANTLIELNKYQESEKILVKLLEEKSGDGEVLHALGIVQRELGRFEDAEKTLLAALKINKISADILFDLAVVYEKTNKREKAIIHYRKSVDFVPDFTEAHEGLKRLGIESYTPKLQH